MYLCIIVKQHKKRTDTMYYIDAENKDTGCCERSAEVLGDSYGVDYPSREEAEAAAQELRETAAEYECENVIYSVTDQDPFD